MGEFELIARYFAAAACARTGDGVVLGIGDDCALLQPASGRQLAVSTDTLIERVHFPAGCDPEALGRRALAVAASDLAAMGAQPLAFTLALTLPVAEEHWLERFALGLNAMAEHCRLRLIGGDTTRGPLSLTLTVFGELPAGAALTRCGARPGDWLCVSGALGDAAAALPLVLRQRQAPAEVAEALLQRYWSPQPQLALGQALRGRATAALDISDGLLADCGHLARASAVTVQIEAARIPLSAALQRFAGSDALSYALGGGDDYQLVFSMPPERADELLRDWPDVRVIGRILTGPARVELLDAEGRQMAQPHPGYQHFPDAEHD